MARLNPEQLQALPQNTASSINTQDESIHPVEETARSASHSLLARPGPTGTKDIISSEAKGILISNNIVNNSDDHDETSVNILNGSLAVNNSSSTRDDTALWQSSPRWYGLPRKWIFGSTPQKPHNPGNIEDQPKKSPSIIITQDDGNAVENMESSIQHSAKQKLQRPSYVHADLAVLGSSRGDKLSTGKGSLDAAHSTDGDAITSPGPPKKRGRQGKERLEDEPNIGVSAKVLRSKEPQDTTPKETALDEENSGVVTRRPVTRSRHAESAKVTETSIVDWEDVGEPLPRGQKRKAVYGTKGNALQPKIRKRRSERSPKQTLNTTKQLAPTATSVMNKTPKTKIARTKVAKSVTAQMPTSKRRQSKTPQLGDEIAIDAISDENCDENEDSDTVTSIMSSQDTADSESGSGRIQTTPSHLEISSNSRAESPASGSSDTDEETQSQQTVDPEAILMERCLKQMSEYMKKAGKFTGSGSASAGTKIPKVKLKTCRKLVGTARKLERSLTELKSLLVADTVETGVIKKLRDEIARQIEALGDATIALLNQHVSADGTDGNKITSCLMDMYLHVFPHLVTTLKTLWRCYGASGELPLRALLEAAAISDSLKTMVEFARLQPIERQPKPPKGESYQIRKPTQSMRPDLLKFIKHINKKIESLKMAKRRAQFMALQPAIAEERARKAKEAAEQAAAEIKERRRKNLEAQRQALTEIMAALAPVASIAGSHRSKSLSRGLGTQQTDADIQRDYVEIDDDPFAEDSQAAGIEERLSMLGSKNTNDAALEDKWTETDWEILIDGLMRNEGPDRYSQIREIIDRDLDEIFKAAKEFKSNMELHLEKQNEAARRNGEAETEMENWVTCIGKEQDWDAVFRRSTL